MLISLAWLNSLFPDSKADPLSADQVEALLTALGFPIESRLAVPLPSGTIDTRLDVEITSNRGDCLSHVGIAREIAAKTSRLLQISSFPAQLAVGQPAVGQVAAALKLINSVPGSCPRFTARVIKNVTVGPSPAWLVARLEAVGQRSINNVVDATNYISFELGNPSHVFDLATLKGGQLHVRYAHAKESLATLDGKVRTLKADELVVADAERAQSLAGVIGGRDSQVTAATRDIVVEVATWDPVHVRRAARNHGVRTDASHRFERTVPAATLNAAMERLVGLILEIAGGQVCEGTLDEGQAPEATPEIALRPARVQSVLGYEVSVSRIVEIMNALTIETRPMGRGGDGLVCTPPVWRPDLTREIDLIEEIARVNGLDAIPVLDGIRVVAKPPQHAEKVRRSMGYVLTGLGYFETVTFTFVTRDEADLFMPTGLARVEVDEARRAGAPALRPSVVPSLLSCRRANQHAGVKVDGGIRLFETAAVMAQTTGSEAVKTVENRVLALQMDVPVAGKRATDEEIQTAVRLMRGTIDAVVREALGTSALVRVSTAAPHCAAYDLAAYAKLEVEDVRTNKADAATNVHFGYMALLTSAALARYELFQPVVVAEVNLSAMVDAKPPLARVAVLPEFAATWRDLSFVVEEKISWGAIEAQIEVARMADTAAFGTLEGVSFVGVYRGEPLEKGYKSVTVRLQFRDMTKTMRAEEADGPTNALVAHMKATVGATLRV